MLSTSLLFQSVSELAKKIESKQISPVELTESYLARSEKIGAELNAYARLMPDSAMEQARDAEKEIRRGHYRGALHGIPYAAKDLLAVKGVPTTWGAKPFANQVFDYNATVIEHLNHAGAILIGKAAMIELAGGMGYMYASASLQGETKNPWNTDVLDVRIVVGLRSDRCGRTGRIRDRHGNLGIDSVPIGFLRNQRVSADVRAREPLRGDGPVIFHG